MPGRCARTPNRPKTTIHNADEALSSALVWEGTHCIPQVCSPLQMATPSSDITRTWRHCPARSSGDSPRQNATAISSAPLMKKRTPANSNGRQVEDTDAGGHVAGAPDQVDGGEAEHQHLSLARIVHRLSGLGLSSDQRLSQGRAISSNSAPPAPNQNIDLK